MYELWARKKNINGYGQPFEFITVFTDIQEKYYWCDTLDSEIYEEAIVIENNRLIFYKEFDSYEIKKKVK